MEKNGIKDLLYGGLSELMQNRKYYYHSSVSPEYSNWTAEGAASLSEYIRTMSNYIYVAEQESLDKRAKELTISLLKS